MEVRTRGDGRENVDGRVVVLPCKIGGEDDMAVENGADLIGHGLVHVVAGDQNRIESRDGPDIGVS